MKEDNSLKTIYIDSNEEEEIDFLTVFRKYGRHWKWFVFSVFGFLLLGYLYIQYTPSLYQRSTTIFIDDKESGGLNSEISAFEDLGGLGGNKTSVINEMGVLRSLKLMETVVEKLKFNVSYFEEGYLIQEELYAAEVPFNVNFFVADSIFHHLDTSVVIHPISKHKFSLESEDGFFTQEYEFGKNIFTKFGQINVTPNQDIEFEKDVEVRINPLRDVANAYLQKLDIQPQDKKSSLIVLTLVGPIQSKVDDLLDELVFQYNLDGIEYKKLITENTDRFINERINDISVELSDVDKGVEDFKTKNDLTDMAYEANLVLSTDTEVDRKIMDLTTQIQLVDYVSDHMQNNKDDLIPANLGIQDNSTSQNTLDYNRLLLERNRIIKSSSKMNPTVINLDAQISNLRQSIEQSLSNFRSSLSFSLNEARNQKYRLNAKRKIAPQQEREFQDIKRKQQIIETLYLYLLEKREENAIALGMPVPKAKVIDKANGLKIPVSPLPMLIYPVSLLLGLLLPFVLLTVRNLLDNKVHSAEEVEKIIHAPILGDIPLIKNKKNYIVQPDDKSGLAESFRLLRTNMSFMIPKSGFNKASTVFVTSTIGGEGKTFVSLNLAMVLSAAGKKVLWIGADLRKPKIEGFLKGAMPKFGLSNFLSEPELDFEEVVAQNERFSFDFIVSGQIPPNPSELLSNLRFEELMLQVKQAYDYVIVDTPPVSLVTDTLLMSDQADLFIYVVRANFVEKELLKTGKSIFEHKRLPNMALLINATDDKKRGYGYGYGYGHETKIREPWYKKVFKSAAV